MDAANLFDRRGRWCAWWRGMTSCALQPVAKAQNSGHKTVFETQDRKGNTTEAISAPLTRGTALLHRFVISRHSSLISHALTPQSQARSRVSASLRLTGHYWH